MPFITGIFSSPPIPLSVTDLNVWTTNFGSGSLITVGQAVPKPASLALLALGLPLLVWRNSWRQPAKAILVIPSEF